MILCGKFVKNIWSEVTHNHKQFNLALLNGAYKLDAKEAVMVFVVEINKVAIAQEEFFCSLPHLRRTVSRYSLLYERTKDNVCFCVTVYLNWGGGGGTLKLLCSSSSLLLHLNVDQKTAVRQTLNNKRPAHAPTMVVTTPGRPEARGAGVMNLKVEKVEKPPLL